MSSALRSMMIADIVVYRDGRLRDEFQKQYTPPPKVTNPRTQRLQRERWDLKQVGKFQCEGYEALTDEELLDLYKRVVQKARWG